MSNLKQIALSKQYKTLINKKVKYIGTLSNGLQQGKTYTIDTIKSGTFNAYITLKEVKTSFDIPYNTDLFELIQEPTIKSKQIKLTKLTMLFILFISLFTSSHVFAATKNTPTFHYKSMHLTIPHTIRTSYHFKAILTHPRTNKTVNHIKVSKPYKTTHTTKIISYKPHRTALKHTTIHYPKVKTYHFKITHVSYHSTYHAPRISTHSSYHFHRTKF